MCNSCSKPILYGTGEKKSDNFSPAPLSKGLFLRMGLCLMTHHDVEQRNK